MFYLKERDNIQQSYLVCSTGRSGSTLLCKTLNTLQCCGHPEEYFHHTGNRGLNLKHDLDGFLEYFNSILREGTTSNGTFGIKMHWWQLDSFLKILKKYPCFADSADLDILNSLFPKLKFIYIWRQDMLAQAVSTTIAQQTRVWKQVIGNDQKKAYAKTMVTPAPEGTSVKFKPLKIYRWEQSFKDQNRRWQKFLTANNLDYYELTYEDLIQSFEREMKQVLAFLDVEEYEMAQAIQMATRKQSNTINQEFIRKYKRFPPLSLKFVNKIKRLRQQ